MKFSTPLSLGTGLSLGLALLVACGEKVQGTGPDPGGDGDGDGSGDGDADGGTSGDGDGDGDGDTSGDGDGDGDTTGDGDGDGDTSGDGDGDGDTSGDGGTSGDGDGDGDTSATGGTSDGTGGLAETSCADALLEDDSVTVNTAQAEDEVALSCASGTAPDVILEWVAPLDDYFSFDTAGSDYDTAIAVLQDSCDGGEIDCSSGTSTGQFGRAVVKAERDETYYIVVSGNSGDSGNAELSVAPVSCPGLDLTDQPLPATFTTLGGTDDIEVTCDRQGATAQPEKTFRYTADASSLYRFSAASAAFRPVVDVYEGVICGGQHLGCNAGQVGSTSYPAEVTRYLDAGESVTIVVQGENGAGEFEFNVEELSAAPTGGCYDPPTLGASESGTILSDGTNEISGSCAWAGNSIGAFTEHLFKFNVDLLAPAVCSVDVETELSGIVILLAEGDCSGPEMECRPSAGSGSNEQSFYFTAADNGEYILAVENHDSFGGSVDYSITSTCL